MDKLHHCITFACCYQKKDFLNNNNNLLAFAFSHGLGHSYRSGGGII